MCALHGCVNQPLLHWRICIYIIPLNLPSDVSSLQVTIGDVTLPLAEYPDGAYFDPEKSTMTVAEQSQYGIHVGGDLNLRGWECVGFARYVYAALFYKYPQDATMDNQLPILQTILVSTIAM